MKKLITNIKDAITYFIAQQIDKRHDVPYVIDLLMRRVNLVGKWKAVIFVDYPDGEKKRFYYCIEYVTALEDNKTLHVDVFYPVRWHRDANMFLNFSYSQDNEKKTLSLTKVILSKDGKKPKTYDTNPIENMDFWALSQNIAESVIDAIDEANKQSKYDKKDGKVIKVDFNSTK